MAITLTRSFKVTDFGNNRKPMHMRLPKLINTNLPPILHRFQVIADYVIFPLATGSLHFNALAGSDSLRILPYRLGWTVIYR